MRYVISAMAFIYALAEFFAMVNRQIERDIQKELDLDYEAERFAEELKQGQHYA